MSMLSNFFGKGFKRFAGIFSKFVPESVQLNRDTIIIKNNINNHIEGEGFLNKSLGHSGMECISTLLDEEKLRADNKILNFPKKFQNLKNKVSAKLLNSKFMENGDYLSGLSRNNIRNRVCSAIVQANNPIEDQCNAMQLKYFDGFFVSVFDGHGGEEVAQKTKQNLHLIFDEKFKELEKQCISIEDKVKESIEYAFSEIVKNILGE